MATVPRHPIAQAASKVIEEIERQTQEAHARLLAENKP